jgi:hypothetical protein
LTGRSEELQLIKGALCGSDASGMVVSGAAGVGKSRIVREGLSAAASTGCETRWAVGTSSARALPLGAFAAWVGSAVTDTLELVRGVIESLTSSPRGATVVVGVDDAHLLDDLSTFVLHQIVQRRAAKVVFTVRDGEPIPQGLREIWKVGQIERLANLTLVGRPFRVENGVVVALRRRSSMVLLGRRLAGRWSRVVGPSLLPPLVFRLSTRIRFSFCCAAPRATTPYQFDSGQRS